MTTYTGRQLRHLKKDARAFADNAKPRHIYYKKNTFPGPCGIGQQELLMEISFEPSSLSSRLITGTDWPRWYGPRTVYDCYIQYGPLYADRSHRDISGLRTIREQAAADAEFERQLLNSPQWRKELNHYAAAGFTVLPDAETSFASWRPRR